MSVVGRGSMVKSFHFKSPCSHFLYCGMAVFLCSYTFVSLSLSLLSAFPLSNLVNDPGLWCPDHRLLCAPGQVT